MSEDNTYRVVEIVGTSPESIAEAVKNGVERASQTLEHLNWFEVTQTRGHIEDGRVAHFQVYLKVGFRMDEPG
jgi:flavin-binding protein dodecin